MKPTTGGQIALAPKRGQLNSEEAWSTEYKDKFIGPNNTERPKEGFEPFASRCFVPPPPKIISLLDA